MANNMDRQCGLTLLELMTTLALSGVLLVLGIPSMIEFVRDARRDQNVMDIVSGLNVARSESIRRGSHVVACPSHDGASCSNGHDWGTGWLAFVDQNGNGQKEGDDPVIRSAGAAGDGITITGGRAKLVFRDNGYSLGTNDTLRICDSRGVASGKGVVINMIGRVRVTSAVTQCP